jgi:DNA-binding beta-propeller fold protein YncE
MGGSGRDSGGFKDGARAGSAATLARSRCGRGTRRVPRSIVALCLAALGLLLSSAPALAAGNVEHAFGRSFKGEEHCKFFLPRGLAVNESTGEVYVYDHFNNSVDRLSPTGACLTHLKVSAAAAGETANEGIAVDNSSTSPSKGDLYVAAKAEIEGVQKQVILKFKPEGSELKPVGEPIEHEFEARDFEEIHGLAVDGAGDLWAYQGNNIDRFSNAVANVAISQQEVGSASSCQPRPVTEHEGGGFAIGPEAEAFYVGRERESTKLECEEKVAIVLKLNSAAEPAGEPPRRAQLDNENTTGVAADQSSGEVYFDNRTSVVAFSSSGSFVQRFGSGNLEKARGVAVDSATQEVYVVDSHEDQVEVFVAQASPPPPPSPKPEIELPDKRGWEMVTPQNKLGAAIFPVTLFAGIVQASEDGTAITYTTSAPIVPTPPTNRSPEATSNLSKRGSEAWSSEDIATPRSQSPNGFEAGSGTEYRFFSPDLSLALVQPNLGIKYPNEPPLSPEATETTLYWRTTGRTSAECEPIPSTCYEALVTPGDVGTTNPFGAKLHFLNATPDTRHAVLTSIGAPLTPGAGERGLYEWEHGSLRFVSVFPNPKTEGTPEDPRLGAPGEQYGGIMRHAISNDGSRVFWSEKEGGLFLWSKTTGTSVRLDTAHGVAAKPESIARFQTASTDGSKVFFTDTSRLTATATEEGEAEEGQGDLYVCEVVEEAGKLHCNLTDLTATVNAKNESAQVQGVIGASEDGSYVYFVADGALAGNAGGGQCEPNASKEAAREEMEGKLQVTSCNLYVEHYNAESGHEGWEAPKLIAPLTSEDHPDWQVFTEGGGALGSVTSRVSPKGRYLAFMSNSPLTGYNNVDTRAHRRDEEVFLFDFVTNRVICASCNPTGAPPTGVFDGGVSEESSDGTGRLVDRPGNWAFHWLAGSVPGWTAVSLENALYQSRYLSDTGRLFFNAADPLVAADKNHVEDVYEYEPAGEGTCESATGCVALISSGSEHATRESDFLDASVSGNDVFFLTAEQLVPQDQDTAYDVYDAHVCTGSLPCFTPPPAPPAPCSSEACRPPASSAPALPGVPASTLPGPGNAGTHEVLPEKVTKPPPKKETRAQKLAKALKACKKIKSKKKHAACVKRAHRLYGSSKKGKK